MSNTCTEALATTEVMIHPRALFLGPPPTVGVSMETVGNQSQNPVFGLGFYGGIGRAGAAEAGAASTGLATSYLFGRTQTKQVAPPGVVLVRSADEPDDQNTLATSAEDNGARDIEVVSLDSSDNEEDKELVEVEIDECEDGEMKEEDVDKGNDKDDVISIDDDDDDDDDDDGALISGNGSIEGGKGDILDSKDTVTMETEEASKVRPGGESTPSTSALPCTDGSPGVSGGQKRKQDSEMDGDSPSTKKVEVSHSSFMVENIFVLPLVLI